ncbi:MAG TPA: PKD domain-containing protein [Candidatus Thermoplasmatota archaeon]|nr:PKD domain-containing protein [Candidatus Thermoplasmatota archaeon]
MSARPYLAAVAALAILLGAQAHGGLPLEPSEAPVREAVGFLRAKLQPDGCVAGDSGCGHATTSWASFAAASAGEDLDAWRLTPSAATPLEALRDRRGELSSSATGSGPTDHARAILALLAAGEDPRRFDGHDWAASLVAFHGAVQPKVMGDPSKTHHAIWAALALARLDEPALGPVLDDLLVYLRSAQGANGGFGAAPQAFVEADTTGAALMALAALGLSRGDPTVDRALLFLEMNQRENGGFTNGATAHTQSTALAVQGILAVGEDPLAPRYRKSGGDPLAFLLASRAPSGGFGFQPGATTANAWATSQVVPALRGMPFPILAPRAKIAWSPPEPSTAAPVELRAVALDPGGGPLSYRWRVDGADAGEGEAVSHRFDHRGPHEITLTVRDADGLLKTARQTLVVGNAAPVPALAAPARAFRNATVEFHGLASMDPDGTIVAWRFDFGDGHATRWTDAPVAEHAFRSLGSYTVRLAVRDADGAVATAARGIVVENRPPLLSLAPAWTADRVSPLRLHAEASDVDGSIASWRWDFGSGDVSSEPSPERRFESLGARSFVLAVTDSDGGVATASGTIEVANLPPRIAGVTVLPSPARAGAPVRLTAEAHDPDGPPPVVRWRWGDASFEGSSIEAIAPSAGDTEVLLEVVDEDGALARAVARFHVVDPANETQAPSEEAPAALAQEPPASRPAAGPAPAAEPERSGENRRPALHVRSATVDGERVFVEGLATDEDGDDITVFGWLDGRVYEAPGPSWRIEASFDPARGARPMVLRALDSQGFGSDLARAWLDPGRPLTEPLEEASEAITLSDRTRESEGAQPDHAIPIPAAACIAALALAARRRRA